MSPNKTAALAQTWRRTLGEIPSVLGRLTYMSSLRNANTGNYEHFGIAERVGPAETDRMLRLSHQEVFEEWLCYGLSRQKEEMDEYLSGLPGDKREIIANWLSLEPFGSWVPVESKDMERKLFHSDLAIVLELIRADYGVASRDPG